MTLSIVIKEISLGSGQNVLIVKQALQLPGVMWKVRHSKSEAGQGSSWGGAHAGKWRGGSESMAGVPGPSAAPDSPVPGGPRVPIPVPLAEGLLCLLCSLSHVSASQKISKHSWPGKSRQNTAFPRVCSTELKFGGI